MNILNQDYNSKTWEYIFFVLILFSLTFDYRSLDGSIFVVILGLLNILAAVGFIFYRKVFNKFIICVVFVFWVYAITVIFSGIFRGQELFSVFAQTLPVIIFANAVLISFSYIDFEKKYYKIIELIIISGLLAAIWKLCFAIIYFDLNYENMRYQILSGATILLYSYGISCLIIKKNKYGYLALILSLGVVFLSVTRSYILIFTISTLISLLLLNFKNSIHYLIKVFLALLGVLITIALVFPEFSNRWLDRVGSLNEDRVNDITSLTRIAEINGQIYYLSNDFLGLLFGFGAAAKTEWMGEELTRIVSILGSQFPTTGFSYGHNLYVGIIYVGGILLGLPVIFILLGIPFIIFMKVKKYYKSIPVDQKFIIFFCFCSVIGYLTYGLVGAAFLDRSISFYFGIVFGILAKFIVVNFRISSNSKYFNKL